MLAPRNGPGQEVCETVNMWEPIALCFTHDVRRLFVLHECLHTTQEKFSHGDDGFVADAEVFPTAVEDRPHALGSAGIMVEKVFDAGEVHRLLHLTILQVVVARVTKAEILGADLFSPVHFVFAYRPGATKTDIVAPAMSVVRRRVRMDFVAVELVCRSAGITKAENRT